MRKTCRMKSAYANGVCEDGQKTFVVWIIRVAVSHAQLRIGCSTGSTFSITITIPSASAWPRIVYALFQNSCRKYRGQAENSRHTATEKNFAVRDGALFLLTHLMWCSRLSVWSTRGSWGCTARPYGYQTGARAAKPDSISATRLISGPIKSTPPPTGFRRYRQRLSSLRQSDEQTRWFRKGFAKMNRDRVSQFYRRRRRGQTNVWKSSSKNSCGFK